MKRGIIVVLVLVIVGGALGGGWWWARTYPEQATRFLVDGGLEAGRAETFVASLGGQAEPEEAQALVASGSIEGEEVAIVSEFGGQIVALRAEEGDEVQADQVLVELDASLLQAQMAQAALDSLQQCKEPLPGTRSSGFDSNLSFVIAHGGTFKFQPMGMY